jgi:cytochrome c oxidase subunit 4
MGKHEADHHIPLATYYKILGTLLVFTVITVAVAQIDFGSMNTVIAMLIASIKAGFVLAYFMHLKYDNKLYVVCFGTGIFFLVVLFFFSWLDIVTRILPTNIL